MKFPHPTLQDHERLLLDRPQHPLYHPSRLPPPLTTPTRNLGATRLQLLQNVDSILAIQIQAGIIRTTFGGTAPPNLLNHVIRVRSANHWHLRGEPLLEWLCDKEAVCGEPARHWGADVDFLRGVGCVGDGGKEYVAFVDGDVFFGGGGYSNLWGVS